MSTQQIRSLSHKRRILGVDYINKILALNPLVYFLLNEGSGTAAVNLGSLGAAANGTYTGVTLNNTTGPDGVNGVPFFDGTNDSVDIYSAALDAAFDGAEGTLMVWCRVANSGVWTDGLARLSVNVQTNLQNRYATRKWSTNNTVRGTLRAANTGPDFDYSPFSSLGWWHHLLTWSDGTNDDEAKCFLDGVQVGTTSAALGNWSGSLANAETRIGSYSPVANHWHGWLGHVAILDYVLTPAQIAAAARI